MKKIITLIFIFCLNNNLKSQNLKIDDIQKFGSLDFLSLKSFLLNKGYEVFNDLRGTESEMVAEFNYKSKNPFHYSILSFQRNAPNKLKVIGDLQDTLVFCKIITDSKKLGYKIVDVTITDHTKNSSELFAISDKVLSIQMKNGKEEIWLSLNTVNKLIPYISLPSGLKTEKYDVEYKYSFVYLVNYNITQY